MEDLNIYDLMDVVLWVKPEYLSNVLQVEQFYPVFNQEYFWKEYSKIYVLDANKREDQSYRQVFHEHSQFKRLQKWLSKAMPYYSGHPITRYTSAIFIGHNRYIKKIPKEITILSHLNILTIQFCNIETIPIELCKLNNLELIYLTANRISTVPKELANMPKLRMLYLCENRIRNIPIELLYHPQIIVITGN